MKNASAIFRLILKLPVKLYKIFKDWLDLAGQLFLVFEQLHLLHLFFNTALTANLPYPPVIETSFNKTLTSSKHVTQKLNVLVWSQEWFEAFQW